MSIEYSHIRYLLAIASIAVMSAGCTKDNQDLYDFIETEKTRNVGSVKPLPQFEPYESFSYTAGDLRDPFVAKVDLEEEDNIADGPRPETGRPKQPLEKFPLDTLAMVGILEQASDRWGLIKDPQNVVHRVKIGNYMGQNEGRILEINETEIVLVEIIPDGIGGFIERDASIAIGNE